MKTAYVIYTISEAPSNRQVTLFLNGYAQFRGYILRERPVNTTIFGIIDIYIGEDASVEERVILCSSNSLYRNIRPECYYKMPVQFNLSEKLYNDHFWHMFGEIDQIAFKALLAHTCIAGNIRYKDKGRSIRGMVTKIEECLQKDLAEG